MQIQQPYVDLASAQTIVGAKTFSATLTASGSLAQGTASAESIAPSLRSTSVTVSAAASNNCSAAGGAITLTLPTAASSQNCRIMFTKTDASANAVTIEPQAGGTIGGTANVVLTAQYQSVTLLNINGSVAGAWVVVGKT